MLRCWPVLLTIAMLPLDRAIALGDFELSVSAEQVPSVNGELLPPGHVVEAWEAESIIASGNAVCADIDASKSAQKLAQESEKYPPVGGFWGYRVSEHWSQWMVGNGQQYGDFSFGSNHYLKAGLESGLGAGIGFHFLSGPDQTDMPPMLFDFSLGYQKRDIIGDLAYDVAFSVLAASDFEGSSRDGVRFPAHAVGYLAFTETIDLVFGADFLDREDIRVLPVGGILWRPDPAIRIELVFPTPRIDLVLSDTHLLYFRGGLGGDTWAVERDSELDDLATYYDLQVAIGLGTTANTKSSIEIAYLFDRRLEYASGIGDYDPGPTVMIRSVARY